MHAPKNREAIPAAEFVHMIEGHHKQPSHYTRKNEQYISSKRQTHVHRLYSVGNHHNCHHCRISPAFHAAHSLQNKL